MTRSIALLAAVVLVLPAVASAQTVTLKLEIGRASCRERV